MPKRQKDQILARRKRAWRRNNYKRLEISLEAARKERRAKRKRKKETITKATLPKPPGPMYGLTLLDTSTLHPLLKDRLIPKLIASLKITEKQAQELLNQAEENGQVVIKTSESIEELRRLRDNWGLLSLGNCTKITPIS